jgi:hypothetical protein
MPIRIPDDVLAQIHSLAHSGHKYAEAVLAFIEQTFYAEAGASGEESPASVATSGNVFPMDLGSHTLVAKLSSDGGGTWGSPRTHTFPTNLKAELDLATCGIGALDTVVEATTGGVEGNDITIALTGDGTKRVKASKDYGSVGSGAFDSELEAVTPGVAGNSIRFALAGDCTKRVKASKDFSTVADGKFDSVVVAETAGTAGNSLTVSLAGTGAPASGVVISHPSGNVFDIVYEDNVSTVLDIENAINALSGGDKLISVPTPSANPTVKPRTPASDFTATSLAGGVDGQAAYLGTSGTDYTFHFEDDYTTVAMVEALIPATVTVKTPGTGGTVLDVSTDEFALTALAGGVDGTNVTITRVTTAFTIHFEDLFSTVLDVENAIAALAGGDDLFGVKTAGTPGTVLDVSTDEFTAESLAGGTSPGVFANIAALLANIVADTSFLGTVLLATNVGNELTLTTVAKGTDVAVKIDATSTGIGVGHLRYTSDQTGYGFAGLAIQVKNQAGKKVAGVRDVRVQLLATAGSPTMSVAAGTAKKGDNSADLWAQTNSAGLLGLEMTAPIAGDLLFCIRIDNGTVEMLRATAPL